MPATDPAASQQSQDPLSDPLKIKVDSPHLLPSSENNIRGNNHLGDMSKKLLETAATSSTNGQQRRQPIFQNSSFRTEHSQASREVRTSKRHS